MSGGTHAQQTIEHLGHRRNDGRASGTSRGCANTQKRAILEECTCVEKRADPAQCTVATQRTGSLAVPIVMHMVFNAVNVALAVWG